jgi:hypothetical protein
LVGARAVRRKSIPVPRRDDKKLIEIKPRLILKCRQTSLIETRQKSIIGG